jgi:hypothetical protein
VRRSEEVRDCRSEQNGTDGFIARCRGTLVVEGQCQAGSFGAKMQV